MWRALTDDFLVLAGKSTTDDQLEEMLETQNPAIFTQGVRKVVYSKFDLYSCIRF